MTDDHLPKWVREYITEEMAAWREDNERQSLWLQMIRTRQDAAVFSVPDTFPEEWSR